MLIFSPSVGLLGLPKNKLIAASVEVRHQVLGQLPVTALLLFLVHPIVVRKYMDEITVRFY
jgi:hypothetical protein